MMWSSRAPSVLRNEPWMYNVLSTKGGGCDRAVAPEKKDEHVTVGVDLLTFVVGLDLAAWLPLAGRGERRESL